MAEQQTQQNPNPSNPNPAPPSPAPGRPPAAPPKAPETWAAKTFTKPELKAHVSLAKFQSPDALGESYLALEKKFGDRNAHTRPGPDASDADKAEFAKWLGVPEGADKYSLNVGEKIKEMLPEGTPIKEAFVKGAFEAFHKAGMTDEQATSVIGFFAEQQSAEMAAMSERLTKGIDDLKKECGHAYEAKLAVAGRAIDQLAEGEHKIEGLAELMDPNTNDLISLWVQSSPAMIRLFMFLGEAMGEDELVEGQHRSEEQVGDLKTKKAELMKKDSPYWNSGHADHKKFVDDVAAINNQLSGGNGAA